VPAVDLTLAVFVFVYGVMIVGRVPGLRLDRTGAALVGAVVLVAAGVLSANDAWRAVDVGTIGLLLGSMIVSAQFHVSGCWAALTRWLALRPTSPERLLLDLVLTAGVASALLTNDVVCIAIAPVLSDVCTRRRLDPVPFLLALAAAANVGSAATLIGNPQNMLIAQSLHTPFGQYLLDGCVPAGVGLVLVWWILARSYRGRFSRELPAVAVLDVPFDRRQTTKGIVVLSVFVFGLLVCPLPREVLALAAGSVLLLSRRIVPRALLHHVDWQLLVLFAGLFVCNHAFQQAGHAAATFDWLRDNGVDLADPRALFATAAIGSNLVSNVPLTMLLLPVAEHPQAAPILCLATTLAGNLLLVGSIANLIVVEQALRLGVRPARRSWFVEHARTGVPITVATMAVAALWLWWRA
jgi:Na+/H+ antiporter NhaD/arsenite permease-like protein